LLDVIADDVGLTRATSGIVVALTQVGYGLGLLALVPLGDLLDRRRLIISQSLLMVFALSAVALAPTGVAYLAGMAAVGALSVVTQLHVAHASALAGPTERGRVVGMVTSGIVGGILCARAVSGLLSDTLGWRAVYGASGGANLIVLALLIKALPSQATPSRPIGYVRLVTSAVALFSQEPVLRIRATLALLTFMAMTVLWTPMVLALRSPPLLLTHMEVGLFGFSGVLGALGASRAGRWSDRGFAQRTTGLALVLMLAAWLPGALLSRSLWGLVAGVLALDFGLQAVHVANQSLIYRVRPEAQSRLTAGYMVFYSIGCALGSIVSTLAFDQVGWIGVCVLGASISAIAFGFWALTRHLTPDDASA
jgi:predicted MFS family arabinose efflux permease